MIESPDTHECSDFFEMIPVVFNCLDGSTSYRNALHCTICGNLFVEETDEDPCPPEMLDDREEFFTPDLPDIEGDLPDELEGD